MNAPNLALDRQPPLQPWIHHQRCTQCRCSPCHLEWQNHGLVHGGGSILTSLNLSEWIAHDWQNYEDKVVRLASHPDQRIHIKNDLRQRLASVQQQPHRLARSIEKGLVHFHRNNPELAS